MGGILVDEQHRTPIQNLYAAGECCAQYHGANRLGGNSLLGALYGGRVAAKSACEQADVVDLSLSLIHIYNRKVLRLLYERFAEPILQLKPSYPA